MKSENNFFLLQFVNYITRTRNIFLLFSLSSLFPSWREGYVSCRNARHTNLENVSSNFSKTINFESEMIDYVQESSNIVFLCISLWSWLQLATQKSSGWRHAVIWVKEKFHHALLDDDEEGGKKKKKRKKFVGKGGLENFRQTSNKNCLLQWEIHNIS